MPFLNPDHKPIIRHPVGHPVAVRAAFNTTGQFVPRSFCIEDDAEELFKYQVSSIKAVKEDTPSLKIFYCTYDAYGYRNDIVLCYDILKHHWIIT